MLALQSEAAELSTQHVAFERIQTAERADLRHEQNSELYQTTSDTQEVLSSRCSDSHHFTSRPSSLRIGSLVQLLTSRL